MMDIREALRDDAWLAFARRWPVAVQGLGADVCARLGVPGSHAASGGAAAGSDQGTMLE
jgi:hypothetical protein